MTQPGTPNKNSERGIIIWVFVLSLVFLILVVGLAVDGGMLYLTKNKLQSAGDAAALAAARSLNISLSSTQQTTDAQNAAQAFFNANFPNNYMMSSGSSISTSLAYGTGTSSHTVYITTTATVNAPTFFMRWFGYTTVPISVTGTASRRDINVILLFDISESMTNVQPGTSQSACTMMKNAAVSFVGQFSNNRDTLGMVTFNDGTTSYTPTTNFNPSLVTTINGLSCTGDTNTAAGLNAAYAELQALNNSTKLNVIVLFTDGWAEAITADFPVKMLSDSRYGDSQSPYGTVSSSYTMPPSPCKDNAGKAYPTVGWNPFQVGDPGAGATNNTIRGVISENSADNSGPDQTGVTSGPWKYATTAGQGWVGIPGINSSCATMSTGSSGGAPNFYGTEEFRRDIAYIPGTDIYGNATTGYRTDYTGPPSNTYTTGQDEFPTGSTYAGHIRPDRPVTLFNVGYNTSENQGITIRNDATLNPMIITLGLGGNDSYPTDAEFLIRLANVPGGNSPSGTSITNTIYNSTTQQQGLYVYAPNSASLSNAFQKIASFLVELSH